MKGWIVLADTGRPTGLALNLLNAGWNLTVAEPDQGGWTLAEQAIAVFLQAEWSELNRVVEVTLALVDEDGEPALLNEQAGGKEAQIRQQIQVPPTPGAPNGTPGSLSFMIGLSPGLLRVTPRRRYVWKLRVGEDELASSDFWVESPPIFPTIGPPTA